MEHRRQGTLIVSGSVFGAGITCHGICSLDGVNMSSTGPIEVFGEISVVDSTLNGGISDEDIIIWDDAEITWTNSTGTGDMTDNWVNIPNNSYCWSPKRICRILWL